jgi:hypothetical protein
MPPTPKMYKSDKERKEVKKRGNAKHRDKLRMQRHKRLVLEQEENNFE